MEEKRSGVAVPVLVKLAPDSPSRMSRKSSRWARASASTGWVATEYHYRPHFHSGGSAHTRWPQRRTVARPRHSSGSVFRSVTSTAASQAGRRMMRMPQRRRLPPGPSLVQVYTGFIYGGPGLVLEIARRIGWKPNDEDHAQSANHPPAVLHGSTRASAGNRKRHARFMTKARTATKGRSRSASPISTSC